MLRAGLRESRLMRAPPVLVGLCLIAAGCGGHRTASGGIPVQTITLPTRTVTYSVPSPAMEPTMHCAEPGAGCTAAFSDGIVTQEPAATLQRADVVLFLAPRLMAIRCGGRGKHFLRVIGLPGDRFEERHGVVYIDGKKLDEPYVPPNERDTRTITPTTVPQGSYYLLGDNRANACDSRLFGAVPQSNIVGKAIRIVRPS
jgi:signal peptidase I